MKSKKILNPWLCIFALIPVLIWLQHCQRRTDNLPNVIVIYADDLGYGDISCQNRESKIATPNIDQLAAQGMRFTDAHSAAAVCTPSRYALLTGRYCWRTELKKGVLWTWDEPLINKNRMTLARVFKEKGYDTAAIGKWHLGWNWPTRDGLPAKEQSGSNVDYKQPLTGGPLEFGFDYYFGDDVTNFPPYAFIENDRVTEIPTVLKPDSLYGQKGLMVESWKLDQVMPVITDKAVAYIKHPDRKIRPFFLYFPLTAPHDPVAPAAEFVGTSRAGLYGDYVQEVDWTVGQVMRALEQSNLKHNTLVIFTSDNGSRAGDGSNWLGKVGSVEKYGHYANGALRGYKGDIWEGGHRVPFIVHWPQRIKHMQVKEDLICQIDLIATLAAILGFSLPANSAEDSYDFSDLFSGNETPKPLRKILINHSADGSFAIRNGNWKLIFTDRAGGFSNGLFPQGFGIDTPGQLYNLGEDPGERHNLFAQYPDIVKDLTDKFMDIKNNARSRAE